jgi:hypothetical protein
LYVKYGQINPQGAPSIKSAQHRAGLSLSCLCSENKGTKKMMIREKNHGEREEKQK